VGVFSIIAVAQEAANSIISGDSSQGPTFLEGYASWYGGQFHGRKTASGEIFDKEGLSAAHKTLPFGTILRVMNLDTDSSVVVRVNDRGPFVENRILDVSEAAARILGMLASGTAKIRAEVLPPEEAAAFGPIGPRSQAVAEVAPIPENCRIQVASFRDRRNAEATIERLRMSGLSPSLEEAGSFIRVVFPEVAAADADGLAARLRTLGYRDLLMSWLKPVGK